MLAIIIEGARYTPTITLGAVIIAALVSIATLVGIFFGVKAKAQAEAARVRADEAQKLIEVVEEGREVYRRKAERLEAEGKENLERLGTEAKENLKRWNDEQASLLRELADCRQKIGELEARPDLSAIEAILGRMDEQAASRTEQAITAVVNKVDELHGDHGAMIETLRTNQEALVKIMRALDLKNGGTT